MGSKSAKEILKIKGLHAKKSFGQNFLNDPHHLEKIAHEACHFKSNPEMIIFEIGAGLGALTRALLAQGALVHAIERDRDLVPILLEEFAHDIRDKKLVIHEANASTFDFCAVTNDTFVLCGNLPYHLTSTFMLQTLDIYRQLSGAVFMIQAEVADRIISGPGKKVYGLLSVLLQSRFDVSVVHQVPPGAFWPAPKVDSSVIRLIPKAIQPQLNWLAFQSIVKMAFSQRRKTLKNALSKLENATEKMQKAGINPSDRAENLSVDDFIRLLI
jgi:16S rRNA (adenine1518-N6/adenine1519-N6)-dimethyltransferase